MKKVDKLLYTINEEESKINIIKDKLINILDIKEDDIYKVEAVGGMTNKNYLANIRGIDYILRIPGISTESMINRSNEKRNSKLAFKLGIDTEILYFNEDTGIKISKFINNSETLSPRTAKIEENMELTTSILRKLHNSNIKFENEFNVFDEIKKYELLLKQMNSYNFQDYEYVKDKVIQLDKILNQLGKDTKPCHNDTVAENFVKGDNDRIYLIDWEYSGNNDPMWDLAAHIIECNFNEYEEEMFLQKYFETSNIEDKYLNKILIYKICQDFLWSLWTKIKEANGDDFGSYGIERYNRAKQNLLKIDRMYNE